jgi:pyruvate ferredoxin oxidoreductase gamma subunit
MLRIRLHGRGGQGIKTASRILGTAFFWEGYEVQDAPRYGAERRGAPIFAYVRASKEVINERGIINRPDLGIVADESLLLLPVADVLGGVTEHSVLLIVTDEAPGVWKKRLNLKGRVFSLSSKVIVEEHAGFPLLGAACVGAAARLVGVISRKALEKAIREQLRPLGESIIGRNLAKARTAYDQMEASAGCVTEREEPSADSYETPHWIDLPFEEAGLSAPYIHAGGTSLKVETGAWRSLRPVIDRRRCHRCGLCDIYCPDGVISLDAEGYPHIDYQHCKGCLICLIQCPTHAIKAIPEPGLRAQRHQGRGR